MVDLGVTIIILTYNNLVWINNNLILKVYKNLLLYSSILFHLLCYYPTNHIFIHGMPVDTNL